MMDILSNAAPLWLFLAALLASIGVDSARAETADRCAVFRDARQTIKVAHWVVEQRAPEVGDVPDVAVHVAASGPNAAASCLVIQCVAHETTVYLELAARLASRNQGSTLVTYRIENGSWSSQAFWSSNDGLALGLWDSASAAAFAKRLTDGKSLSVKWKFGEGGDLKGEFEIAGAGEALAPIRAACRW